MLNLVQLETIVALFGVLATVGVVLWRLRLSTGNGADGEETPEELPPAAEPPADNAD